MKTLNLHMQNSCFKWYCK